MRIKVLSPTRIAYQGLVVKVSAQGLEGSFTLLPRHIDYTSALVPGLLFFETAEGEEVFMGVSEGVLIKCGENVLISVQNAILGDDLGSVRKELESELRLEDEHERRVRSVLARLQTDFMKRYLISMEEER